MDTMHILVLAGATLGGGLAGAFACYSPLSRVITELRERLERSEQARNGAVERSAQAREQIAQLNRSITELRRAHSASTVAREQVAKSLAAGDERILAMSRREPAQAFADTQIMGSD